MSNKLKAKILKSIKNKKLNVFGLFLLLTFVLLMLTKLSKKYIDNIAFDIVYVNLPENRVITLDSNPKLDAVISDYGLNLLTYHFKKFSFQVDFDNDVFIRDSNYIWDVNKSLNRIKAKLGTSTEIVSVGHDTIKFPFETLSVKKVPVVLNSNINFKSGYDMLNGYILKPDSINVIGSTSDISKIEKVETEMLRLKDVTDTINSVVQLKKLDNKVKFSDDNIKVLAKVEKFTEGTLEVPITIINKPIDVSINYYPKEISVSFYVSLNNYKSIKPLDFKVECDFNEIENTNKTFFTPKLVKSPKLVKNVRLNQNKVEFILIQ